MNQEQNQIAPLEQNYTTKGPRRNTIEILKRLRGGELQPDQIKTHERRVCVAYLHLEGYTQDEIAEIFGVCRRTIARDERANRKSLAKLVDDLEVRSVAGGLIGWASHLTAKAIKGKDFGLAWRVQREIVADLQSLGFLPKAAEKHDIQVGTFVDLARLAIEQTPQQQLPSEPDQQLPAETQEQDDGGEPQDN